MKYDENKCVLRPDLNDSKDLALRTAFPGRPVEVMAGQLSWQYWSLEGAQGGLLRLV